MRLQLRKILLVQTNFPALQPEIKDKRIVENLDNIEMLIFSSVTIKRF